MPEPDIDDDIRAPQVVDFIYNKAYRSGGRWHVVEGEVEFTNIPESRDEFNYRGEGSGPTVRINRAHQEARAKVICGLMTDSYDGEKRAIVTGREHRDDFHRQYAAWKKDQSQPLVITTEYRGPMVQLNPATPPQPLCGHCAKKAGLEAEPVWY
ncbi:MAG TPA: hypothetical protein VLA89_06945 [Gemmatimonadales bacterium]|nr:hypothetical protein [Gemmatimonadales bacterium]